MVLMTDLVICRSGKNDTLIVDCFNCRMIGKLLSKNIKASLINKGYSIKVIPTSVGRFYKENFSARTIETPNQLKHKYKQLPVKNAPFYVDKASDNAKLKEILFKIMSNKNNKSTRSAYHSNINALLLITVTGRKVSSGESFGKALLTGLMTAGTFMVYPVSHFTIELYMINMKTKDIMWYDWYHRQEVEPNEKYMLKGVNALIQRIPDKL